MLIYLQLKMNFPRAGFPPSCSARRRKHMFALHYRWPKELELETSTQTHEMDRPNFLDNASEFN